MLPNRRTLELYDSQGMKNHGPWTSSNRQSATGKGPWVASLFIVLSLLVGVPRPSGAQTASNSAISTPSQLQGSVPTGQATGTTLQLSLKEAIDRALKYNLGVVESDQGTRGRPRHAPA